MGGRVEELEANIKKGGFPEDIENIKLEIMSLIKKGHFEKALQNQRLLDYVAKANFELHKEITVKLYQLKNLKRYERKGLLAIDQFLFLKTKLIYSFLDFLEDIE